MSIIPEEQSHLDIIDIGIDKDTPIGVIGSLLADLDREVTGYPYEVYDENGDNPEEYFSDASIDGYSFEYGPTGMRYPTLRIFLKRDHPERLAEEWRHWMHIFAHYDLKIKLAIPYRNRKEGTRKFNFSWNTMVKGKCPQFSDFPDGIRSLYGVDLNNYEDYRLFFEWINYIFNYQGNRDEVECYHFTGSLGHDGHD